MKRLVFIGFLLLLACAACHTPKGDDDAVETQNHASLPTTITSPTLSAIDSLMWQQPDSALAVLMDYLACRDAMLASHPNDGHYAQLLAAELLYKNDYQQTNRTELQQAVAYFDSLLADTRGVSLHKIARMDASHSSTQSDDLVFLAARAHYINGVGYYEQDSVVQACKEYLTALETMECHFKEKELVGKKAKFMALTFSHLTTLFSDQYLHEQAIYFGKMALEYYRKYDATPWHVAWALTEIGSHYEMMELLDSADFYYNRAILAIPDRSSLIYRDIASCQAYLSYKRGARSETTINKLQDLCLQAESDKERLARCLSIGEVYYNEQQFDSAWCYLSQVFLASELKDGRLLSAERLQTISMGRGDTLKANEYALFRSQFANAGDQDGKLHSKLSEFCQKHVQDRHEMQYRKQTRRIWWHSLVFATVFLTITLVFIVLHFVQKQRHKHLKVLKEETEKQLEANKRTYTRELQEKTLAYSQALAEEKKNAENNLRAKEFQHTAMLNRLNSKVERLRIENKALSEQKEQNQELPRAKKEDYEALLKEGLCVNIKQRLKKADAYTSFDVKDYSSLSLSSKELSELINIIDKHCPDFSRKLKHLCPQVSSNDIQLCRLYLLDLSVMQTAILLNTDYSSIRKRTNNLKKKIDTVELSLYLKTSLFD